METSFFNYLITLFVMLLLLLLMAWALMHLRQVDINNEYAGKLDERVRPITRAEYPSGEPGLPYTAGKSNERARPITRAEYPSGKPVLPYTEETLI